jgi:hypothetical protein
LKFTSLLLKSSIKFPRLAYNKLTAHINSLNILFTLDSSLWQWVIYIIETSRDKILQIFAIVRSLNSILLIWNKSKISRFLCITIEIVLNNTFVISILGCFNIVKTVFLVSYESHNEGLKNISIFKMVFFLSLSFLIRNFAYTYIGWHSSCFL